MEEDYTIRQLWACGFNAWGQLRFDQPAEIDWSDPPEDFRVWQKVHETEELLFMRGGVNSVLVQNGVTGDARLSKKPDNLDAVIKYLQKPFGDYIQAGDSHWRLYTDSHLGLSETNANFLAANDTKICVVNIKTRSDSIINGKPATQWVQERTIGVYGSRKDRDAITSLRENDPEVSFPVPEIRQLVANHTAFHALTEDGKVLSWGDGRFVGVLGRDVTLENPADKPSIIPTLGEDPIGTIRKISAGFNFTAAITSTNDLYVWGYRSDGPGLVPFFESLTGQPESLDVHGYDILDVACGKNYMLVLTTEHRLFVIGTNANGQLGLGDEESYADWKEVVLPLLEGAKMMRVHTGYKSSFVVVDLPYTPSQFTKISMAFSSKTANSQVKDWLRQL